MSRYKINQIDNSTYAITEKIGGVHCYLLVGEAAALLIDSGNGAGALDKLIKSITPLPVRVVNTHGHLDHIGGNYLFAESELPRGEEGVVNQHTDKKYIDSAFKGMLPLVLRAAVRIIAPYMIKPHKFNARYTVSDGDTIDVGGRQLDVISIPGHTTCSACYYDKISNYAFVGDSLINNTVLLNLDYAESPNVYLDSLVKLKTATNAQTLFFSGHTDTPIGCEYLLKFIDCAEAALNGSAQFSRGAESGKACVYAEKCGVRIALKP